MLTDEIQAAVKKRIAILGYRESIKFIKLNQSKLIVMSNNIPDDMRKEIVHHAKLADSKVEIYNGNSRDLGTICGVPYPVSSVIIKG